MVLRLTDPCAIYEALAALQVGGVVPEQVYILDEKNGTIPRWTVVLSEPTGAGGQQMIVEDRTARPGEQPSLFGERYVRLSILTFCNKTLMSRPYLPEDSDSLEWICPRSQLCDLVQQARMENKRQQRQKGVAA